MRKWYRCSLSPFWNVRLFWKKTFIHSCFSLLWILIYDVRTLDLKIGEVGNCFAFEFSHCVLVRLIINRIVTHNEKNGFHVHSWIKPIVMSTSNGNQMLSLYSVWFQLNERCFSVSLQIVLRCNFDAGISFVPQSIGFCDETRKLNLTENNVTAFRKNASIFDCNRWQNHPKSNLIQNEC